MAYEIREPRGQSLAYAMSVGVGRGRSIDGSSVMSATSAYAGRGSAMSSTSASAGRGSVLQAMAVNNQRRQVDMTNARKPYEQYLVIMCCLFALKLMFCVVIVLHLFVSVNYRWQNMVSCLSLTV